MYMYKPPHISLSEMMRASKRYSRDQNLNRHTQPILENILYRKLPIGKHELYQKPMVNLFLLHM
jgi:hypothetical protein